ncbi:MAG: CapA family protein [Deltaproteobacteria bacterium]|nr:CapA family protein [Deltaproteobacteria bacterium]
MGKKVALAFGAVVMATLIAAVVWGIAPRMWPFEGFRKHAGPSMSLVFVGDTGQGDQAKDFVAKHGYRKSFEKIRPLIREHDFLIGNLESTLTDEPPFPGRETRPTQPPEAVNAYAAEGFDVFGLANNHMMDFGPNGLADTLAALEGAGIRYFGAGPNEAAAREPAILEKDGLRVALLGYCQNNRRLQKEAAYAGPDGPGVARLDPNMVRADVERARSRAEYVVVVVHWLGNYRRIEEKNETLIREIAAAKPSLIVCHGPHMPWPIDLVDGVPVLYSIGNFIWHSKGQFKQEGVEDLGYGLATNVTMDKFGIRGIRLTPYECNNRKVKFIPAPATIGQSRELFRQLLRVPRGRVREDGASVIWRP